MPALNQLKEPFKLSLSMVLFYWLALSLDWDLPRYGGLAIVLISLGTVGASLQKGLMRMVGTTAGLLVGLLALALFAQDRWLNLTFFSAYLLAIGYFLQGSRHVYAWYVAGFVPGIVWATTYGQVATAFHYAAFRYLETSAGVAIYTLLTALLWPKRAGDTLSEQGSALWAKRRELFALCRRQLSDRDPPPGGPALAAQIGGMASKMSATLEVAYGDTPAVRARRAAWEALQAKTRAFDDALTLWRETIDDARGLDPSGLLPGLEATATKLDQRLARVAELAGSVFTEVRDTADRDRALLEPAPCTPDSGAVAGLSHFDRAALLAFAAQLGLLEAASREVLLTLRELTDLEPRAAGGRHSLPADPYRPSRWDPSRLITALLPVLCFITAYLFWIVADPPTGPHVPVLVANLSLSLLYTPIRALSAIPALAVAIFAVVAPVYFFVMPWLDTGLGLLILIFVYTFAAGLLGPKAPLYRLAIILAFVLLTGIGNDQTYSFLALAAGAVMIFLAVGLIAIVQELLTSAKPERVLLSGVRRFFRGCAKIAGEFAAGGGAARPARRSRYYRSMVMPVPARLQQVAAQLDYDRFPRNGREQVERLVDALESIAHRLRALDLAYARVTRHELDWARPLAGMGARLREQLQRLFEAWSKLQPVDAAAERAALERLGTDLEHGLDAALASTTPGALDDEALTDAYAVLGCARGLVRAAAHALAASAPLDWSAWDRARF